MALRLTSLLPHLMRPLGAGIPTYSAGTGAAFELQKDHYSIFPKFDDKRIEEMWRASWDELGSDKARAVLIGVPLDTGAGIRRGAAYGPRGVRASLLKNPTYRQWVKKRQLIDLGDIYVNPHLLHDEMLSADQIKACQEGMYPKASPNERSQFAVAALSQLEQILTSLWADFPLLKVFVIGGDHSVAWPVSKVLATRFPVSLGIVQPDAHTDLLSSRLGVKYCFGTWSFHANELLGGNGKLVQLGIRQSGRDRSHWESTTGVKQYWADEIRSRSQESVLKELITHLKSRGVRQIYFSNDIDGTDEAEASATGTPASEGMSSRFVLKVIERLGENFDLVAADIMEVAPDLGPTKKHSKKTCDLAAQYTIACLKKQI